jgi:hypothetical protein
LLISSPRSRNLRFELNATGVDTSSSGLGRRRWTPGGPEPTPHRGGCSGPRSRGGSSRTAKRPAGSARHGASHVSARGRHRVHPRTPKTRRLHAFHASRVAISPCCHSRRSHSSDAGEILRTFGTRRRPDDGRSCREWEPRGSAPVPKIESSFTLAGSRSSSRPGPKMPALLVNKLPAIIAAG